VTEDPAPGSIAAVFTALGDPSRRRVIGLIARTGDATATEIAAELGISRQAVSKHLATLADAGIVETSRVGRETRCRLRTAPLRFTARWLDTAAGDWDDRLERLRDAAEQD
jgi:DNA-binding transcriptional ArsR family regulator